MNWTIVSRGDDEYVAIRKEDGKHVTFCYLEDALVIVSAVNREPAKVTHPDDLRGNRSEAEG